MIRLHPGCSPGQFGPAASETCRRLMKPICIEYRFHLDDGEAQVFKHYLHPETFDLADGPDPDSDSPPPAWTALGFRQCRHCPLDEDEHPLCPAAARLHGLVSRFEHTRSIDPVKLMVITPERRVAQKLDLQHALASMLDLVLPTCGCPKTAYLKPLARFHLPLASEEENVFRVTGMYLLGQYFLDNGSERRQAPFQGLATLYSDLHVLNSALVKRIQSATRSDSIKNAIALIDVYSMLVPLLIEEQLAEMRAFFEAYLPTPETRSETSYFAEAKSFLVDSDEVGRLPDWLKSVAAMKDGAEPEARSRQTSRLEEILSRSTLSLEPIEQKQDDEDGEQEPESPDSESAARFNRFGNLPDGH